nr:biotin-dependent carboxyltransferase family protein [Gordonia soli]
MTVLATGPLATVQDLGRPGYAHLGVPRSGATDRTAAALANRLVGNPESAATVECTLGGLRVRADIDLLIAVTGADAPVSVDGRPVGTHGAQAVTAGAEVRVDVPPRGCRNYLAVRGGIDVSAVLGSRSTDILSDLGPAPLSAGAVVPIGTGASGWPSTMTAPADHRLDAVIDLDVHTGPRSALLADVDDLFVATWMVTPESNRVGVRLTRPEASPAPMVVHRADTGDPASEGIPHGAVQIPPSGRPVVFLADHPVTGGYPVAAVLTVTALDRAAQLVAGDQVRFRPR